MDKPESPEGTSSFSEPESEDLVEQYARRRNEQLFKPRENRMRVVEAIPEIAWYYTEGRLEPSTELKEEGEAQLHVILGKTARYHLEDFHRVVLRHPRSGYRTQVIDEDGTLIVAQAGFSEFDRDGMKYREQVRFAELSTGMFRHDDMRVAVEENPEFAEPTERAYEPAMRVELVSMLKMLLESDLELRERE